MRSDEAGDVEDAERQRQVAAGEEDAVAGAVVGRVVVRRGAVGRVQDLDVAGVERPGGRCPSRARRGRRPRGAKRNSSGQPPTCSNTVAPDRHRALPDGRHLARARRVADAQPRHPVARRRRRRRTAARAAAAARARDRRRTRAATRASASGAASRASSSRKNSSSPSTARDAGVAPARDAAVLGERDRPHAVRQPAGSHPLPTTTTSSSTPRWRAASRAPPPARPAGGPGSGRRSRPLIAAGSRRGSRRRCPSAVIAATAHQRDHQHARAVRSPATASTIAAASASSVASIATNAR